MSIQDARIREVKALRKLALIHLQQDLLKTKSVDNLTEEHKEKISLTEESIKYLEELVDSDVGLLPNKTKLDYKTRADEAILVSTMLLNGVVIKVNRLMIYLNLMRELVKDDMDHCLMIESHTDKIGRVISDFSCVFRSVDELIHENIEAV